MGKRLKRSMMEIESRGSDDGMSPEETAPRKRCSEGRRKTGRKKGEMIECLVNCTDEMTREICSQGEMIQSLVNRMDEMTSEIRKLLEKCFEGDKNQSIVVGKLIENQSCQSKHLEKVTGSLEKVTERLEKLSEGQNDLHKQLELHTKAPRSQWNQEQQPRYQLVFKSNMDTEIEKGKTIEIHVALVDVNNGRTVKNGPLASATVELVVIDAKFNENDNQYNWSREDFVSNVRKAPQGNSATINVDQSVKSIVRNGRFSLENGDKRYCDFTIFSNSGNKKVRLGVMVVSPTQERVLEGLSNPFFVRGHDRPNRKKAQVANGNHAQNGPMSNMQNPSCPNSTQADGRRPVTTPALGGQYQPLSQRNTSVLSTEPATIQQYQVPTMAEAWNSQIGQTLVDDGYEEQNVTMATTQNPSWTSSRSNITGGPPQLSIIGNTTMLCPGLDITGEQQQLSIIGNTLLSPGLNITGGQPQLPFLGNTTMLSTEPSTCQEPEASIEQYQVPNSLMLAQATDNQTDELSATLFDYVRNLNIMGNDCLSMITDLPTSIGDLTSLDFLAECSSCEQLPWKLQKYIKDEEYTHLENIWCLRINLCLSQHLTKLHLFSLMSCEELPQLCQLQVLQILCLENLDKLRSLCSHVVSTPFPELRELRLHDLKTLEKWVTAEGKEELIFPVLEKIVIKKCPKLTRFPEAPKLKDIELDEGKSPLSLALVQLRFLSKELVQLRHLYSVPALVLSIHGTEATRLHQIDQNNDSSMPELNLKGLPDEDRDASHASFKQATQRNFMELSFENIGGGANAMATGT